MNKKNIIILTSGLVGSSVLTAMMSRAGYWVGDQTMKKHDYNTWENNELIELNKKILSDTGFDANWTMEYQPDYIDRVMSKAGHLDPAPYRAFVDKCNQHSPWIWKDPRLWLTIRYWMNFLDKENVFFLIIKRESLQSWISIILRRQIQTFAYLKKYFEGTNGAIMDSVHSLQLPHLEIPYEDLLTAPETVIQRINDQLGTTLTVDDLRAVFRGRLYKKQHGLFNFLKASAIYLKNYSIRYR